MKKILIKIKKFFSKNKQNDGIPPSDNYPMF